VIPHFISLGAGVQSSTMALMAAHGEITPMPTGAIFADTQAEPKAVYEWLDWLEARLPFPVHRVTAGDLRADALKRVRSKTGNEYLKARIPVFTTDPDDGSHGKLGRHCTRTYKIEPINAAIRRLVGIRRAPSHAVVVSWIGISLDEFSRVKPSRVPWVECRWPLIELRMTRQKCLDWMAGNGYPTPPRSACTFCPFHSDAEWTRLKTEEPEAFADAVAFDREIRGAAAGTVLRSTPFLHASRKPLDQVDFRSDVEKGQMTFWQDECSGMCGV
jgi:hypothetical protein